MKELLEKIEKKDLVYIIVILIISRIIVYTSIWGDDGSVIDRISFAGTIVSIILAVLAIIYSYIQNFAYQSSTDKLIQASDATEELVSKNERYMRNFEKTIKFLDDLSKDIIISSNQLEDNIEQIQKAGQNSTQILNKIQELEVNINDRLQITADEISKLHSSPNSQSTGSYQNFDIPKDIYTQFLEECDPMTFYYILYICELGERNSVDDIQYFVEWTFRELGFANKSNLVNLSRGICFGISRVLSGLGQISVSSSVRSLSVGQVNDALLTALNEQKKQNKGNEQSILYGVFENKMQVYELIDKYFDNFKN